MMTPSVYRKRNSEYNLRARGGFTLIETLLYIALFTIVVGGGIVTIFGLLQSSEQTQQRIAIETEGTFFMKKLDWAMSGATIVLPASGTTGTTLSLLRDGTTYDFTLSGTTITLAENSGTPLPLNTLNAPTDNLAFTHTGTSPDALELNFALKGKTFGPKMYYLH